jgi:hypothetical protein
VPVPHPHSQVQQDLTLLVVGQQEVRLGQQSQQEVRLGQTPRHNNIWKTLVKNNREDEDLH